MEEDFLNFLLMLLIWCFPFGFIYLILNLLNWNEGKNLFSGSWIVFLTWLLSSFSTFLILALIEHNLFRYPDGFVAYVISGFSMIVVNICAIAGVLYLRGEKESPLITNYIDENVQKPNIKKICQTSAIISILTLMMVGSLFLAVKDIGEKREKERRNNPAKISDGIYD